MQNTQNMRILAVLIRFNHSLNMKDDAILIYKSTAKPYKSKVSALVILTL